MLAREAEFTVRRAQGYRTQNTVRHSDCTEANVAVRRKFRSRDDLYEVNPAIPHSWEEFMARLAKERPSGIRFTFREAYPLLFAEKDPWGNPWVWRLDCKRCVNGRCNACLTYGSLGPDGIEDFSLGRSDTNSKLSDDILDRVWFDQLDEALCRQFRQAANGAPVDREPDE
jgi:hypothetical protein